MNINLKKGSVAVVLGVALASASFLPALAASTTTVGTRAQAALAARITKGKDRADQEITRRITALNDLNTKVQAMARVSANEKTAISAAVASEVANLTTLKGKIDADTDVETLKTDIKSITASYRIFMLVIP